ncbi:hypothetical protein MNB_SV-3-1026 [hydrothermal vent metagenome]|uniref:Uncharacterized protein n=1 Tax=hydrothermal vent metagenome TaxID=652676 RepID=A0A1W1C4T8_9ZZZZ
MSSQEEQADIRALQLLEKAVSKAQNALEKTTHFQPFLMLLTDSYEVEVYENEVEDSTESYILLENILKERVKKGDIDILILAVDTVIPEKFVDKVSMGIRLHLEEKSQRHKKIGARYLYIPYELCQVRGEDMYVKLHNPIPVGFLAEYIL